MDAWNPDQLLKMQVGGNGKCNDFLGKYGIPKVTDIKEKYNSQAAEVPSPPPCPSALCSLKTAGMLQRLSCARLSRAGPYCCS